MTAPSDLLTRSGHHLWRELPEEWRYRDNPLGTGAEREAGDLEAFLHGMGHLLDLIRGTTEQLHADSFAEPVQFDRPAGAADVQIQPWALAYLSELVGAELVAPDPDQRVPELNAAVRWFKSKGTLASVDELADVVTGIETVTREGWRLVATCPRPSLPPFTLTPGTAAGAESARPAACPDFRRTDRPVRDPAGANPMFRLRMPRRDARGVNLPPAQMFWRQRAPGGVPCFPGNYGDLAPRTPDLRDPSTGHRGWAASPPHADPHPPARWAVCRRSGRSGAGPGRPACPRCRRDQAPVARNPDDRWPVARPGTAAAVGRSGGTGKPGAADGRCADGRPRAVGRAARRGGGPGPFCRTRCDAGGAGAG